MTIQALLKDFIAQQSLPDTYIDIALKWFTPIAQLIHEHQEGAECTVVVGLNGCQGSGKSTLTALLCKILNEYYQKTCIGMSIDDFYLSKFDRQVLSKEVHPLLATRGVPGTHDIELLISTLRNLKSKQNTVIPQFDKSIDDLRPKDEWQVIDYPIDIVILEGWCVGIEAQSENMLSLPINSLEKEHDANGAWRKFVNQQLSTKYANAFSYIDINIMLKSPSFNAVYQWRCEQEHKLMQKLQSLTPNDDNSSNSSVFSGLMSDAQIATFIQYYERLTEHALVTMPAQSDIVISLDHDRGITHCQIK